MLKEKVTQITITLLIYCKVLRKNETVTDEM